jgi:predicted Zn-dependent protease
MAAAKRAPPEFLSTHPSGPSRIRDIEDKLPKVLPLFERAPRPPRNFGPPPRPR